MIYFGCAEPKTHFQHWWPVDGNKPQFRCLLRWNIIRAMIGKWWRAWMLCCYIHSLKQTHNSESEIAGQVYRYNFMLKFQVSTTRSGDDAKKIKIKKLHQETVAFAAFNCFFLLAPPPHTHNLPHRGNNIGSCRPHWVVKFEVRPCEPQQNK